MLRGVLRTASKKSFSVRGCGRSPLIIACRSFRGWVATTLRRDSGTSGARVAQRACKVTDGFQRSCSFLGFRTTDGLPSRFGGGTGRGWRRSHQAMFLPVHAAAILSSVDPRQGSGGGAFRFGGGGFFFGRLYSPLGGGVERVPPSDRRGIYFFFFFGGLYFGFQPLGPITFFQFAGASLRFAYW